MWTAFDNDNMISGSEKERPHQKISSLTFFLMSLEYSIDIDIQSLKM